MTQWEQEKINKTERRAISQSVKQCISYCWSFVETQYTVAFLVLSW